MKATKVNAGLAESNGRLLLGIWRDSLHVTCGLTACTPGSAPGPTLGNEYGKTLPFTFTDNLALSKSAVQRSTRLSANLSVDGRLDTVSCTADHMRDVHTWWAVDLAAAYDVGHVVVTTGNYSLRVSDVTGGSVAEWLACWTRVQKGPGSNRSRDAVG